MTSSQGRKPGKVLFTTLETSRGAWIDLIAERREVVLPDADLADPDIRFAVAWKPQPGLLAQVPGLEAIFSIGAGVDHLLHDPSLPDVPVVRVVDANLSTHMAEYVCWRVLDHHRQGRFYREQQAAGQWRQAQQDIAAELTVGIMGFGELGRSAARHLLPLGFRVRGWSRRGGTMDGVESFAGAARLPAFLSGTDILVVLLPLTDATRGIIDHTLLRQLRRTGPLGGPVLINAGRGLLQREEDLLRALEDGTLLEASLDVFATEPLPADSPLWSHPRVFITPHSAAESDPRYLVPPMLDQMDAYESGEPLRNVVDRKAGY